MCATKCGGYVSGTMTEEEKKERKRVLLVTAKKLTLSL